MNKKSNIWTTINWIFAALFLIIGMLNIFLVHLVPGLIYILFALFYYPPASSFLQKRLVFSVPHIVKFIFGLLILWGTLGVGDLMEIFESWYLR